MPLNRARQVLSGWVDTGRSQLKAKVIKRGTGFSGSKVFEEEPERLEQYIKPKYIRRIFDLESAEKAVNSLKTDSNKGEIGNKDFENLFGNAEKRSIERFAEHLFRKHGEPVTRRIEREEVTLKSGKKRKGIEIEDNIYIIPIIGRRGETRLQARDRRTGRIVKMPRRF